MNRWGVYLYWRVGMAPIDICVYVAFSYDAAFDFAEALPFTSNKKRGSFVKTYGVPKYQQAKHYHRHSFHEQSTPREQPEAAHPIALPAPPAPPEPSKPSQLELFEIKSVWRLNPKTKRRL